MDYLHFNNTLHGDLKPANLLRSSEGRIKIADFGSALVYLESEDTYDGPMNGTPAFRAPETLVKQRKLTSKVCSSQILNLTCACHQIKTGI